jgi:23S rRNA pseudouridine1911/1915/1917 synthase
MRLDQRLIALHPGLSRRRAKEVVEKGQVRLDGATVTEPGLEVADDAQPDWDPNRPARRAARLDLVRLHEDEHLLIVDKPAGLLTVPTPGGGDDEDTALRRVEEYVKRLRPRGAFAARVHRLDRETSGALAFALSAQARAGLIDAFRRHAIDRRYVALVAGEPQQDAGTIDAPIRDEWKGGRRGIAREGEDASDAITHWRVLERLRGFALVEVRLETGRQHQIRAHLAHLGHPVLGDPIYGEAKAPRLMLHAARLGLRHPVTGEPVRADSPLPPDFLKPLNRVRQGVAAGLPRDPRRHRPPRKPASRR